jgi:DNA-binding beta-propeller fold protein YncE
LPFEGHNWEVGSVGHQLRHGIRMASVTALCCSVGGVSTAAMVLIGVGPTSAASASGPRSIRSSTPLYAVTNYVPVSASPTSIAVDPVSHQVYVGCAGPVSVINAITGTTTTVVGTGSTFGTNGVAVDPTIGRVWVPGSIGLQVIDTATNSLIGDVSTYDGTVAFSGALPWGVAVDSTTRTVWSADSYFGAGQVSAINESTNSLGAKNATVDPAPGPTGAQPHGIALDPKRKLVFTADLGDSRLSELTMGGALLNVIDLQAFGGAPQEVAYDSATNRLFVTLWGGPVSSPGGQLLVLDGSTFNKIDEIPLGVDPTGIAFDRADHAIFVTNQLVSGGTTGGLSVIDDRTLTVTQTVNVGAQASAVAVDLATHTVYVANFGSNNVAVVNLQVPPGPGTIQFGSSTSSSAAGSRASITVVRGGATNLTSTVNYATSDGTALSGRDYSTTTGLLTFPPGSHVQTFSVPTLAPAGATGLRTVKLDLTNVTGGSLAPPSSATLNINEQVAPQITSVPPPTTATTGQRYQSTFTAFGAPLPKFSVGSGSLPPGLKLSRAGLLSGRPTTGGTYTFTIAASNGVRPGAATPPITINVSQPPTITADTPPTAWNLNVFGFYHFLATGLPAPVFSVSTGSLPPGLVIYPNGSFGGVPTAVGSWTFTLSASNGVSPSASTPSITLTVS